MNCVVALINTLLVLVRLVSFGKEDAPLLFIITVDCHYSGSLKYGHLDIPAIWLGTEC